MPEKLRTVLATAALLLVAPGLVAQGPPGGGSPPGAPTPVPATLTVQVDCDAGDTLADALARRADELTVEITGSCFEDVVIRRDRTILVGVATGAEIVGSPSPPVPFGGVVTVLGASRVTLTDLTIRDGRRGVAVLDGGGARLERITARNQVQHGLLLLGASHASVEGCSFVDNGQDGLGVWGGSSLTLAPDATTVASRNGRAGVVVSGSSDVAGVGTSRLEADDNGIGVALQLNGTAQSLGLSAARNDFGVWSLLGSSLSTDADVRDSSAGGVFVSDGGRVGLQGTIEDNGAFGLVGDHDGRITFSGAISGHAVGMRLDGTKAFVSGSSVADPVEVLFGTRVDFAGGNNFTGGVSCDATVLVRGDVACPPAPASLSTATAVRGLEPSEEPLVEHAVPFSLEP